MVTSEQKAYEAIRQAITSGTFPGGSHLSAADLAASVGVSRTPVREALRRLMAEGLVESFANRGAFVVDQSLTDVDEVFDLRILLEGHAAALAARRLTADHIRQLVSWTDQMERCATARPRDAAGLTRANEEFHKIIITATANARLTAVIASVVQMSWVARTFSIYSDADLAASIFHHRELIKAFGARDEVWATALMRGHIRAAFHVFASSLRTRSPDASDQDFA